MFGSLENLQKKKKNEIKKEGKKPFYFSGQNGRKRTGKGKGSFSESIFFGWGPLAFFIVIFMSFFIPFSIVSNIGQGNITYPFLWPPKQQKSCFSFSMKK